jgi:hypothetical protein
VFICRRPRIRYPPPPTHCIVFTCIQYTYSHRKGGRGRELNQREGERGQQGRIQITKLDWNTNTIGCTCTLWKTPAAKSLYRSIFLYDDILHWFLWVLSFYALLPPTSQYAVCILMNRGWQWPPMGHHVISIDVLPACDHQGTLLDNDSVEFVLTCTLNSIENPCCHPAYWTMDLRRG